VSDLVSVVIPCYRAERFIARAVKSCLDQGVKKENIIVVEDGVFDDTKSVVERYEGVKLISLYENTGAPNARNIGARYVQTDYVLFLDADDYIEDDYIEAIFNGVSESHISKIDLIFCPYALMSEGSKKIKVNYPANLTPVEWIFRWLNTEIVPPCSVIWRKEFYEMIGGWDIGLKKNQDGEIINRGLLNDPVIHYPKGGYGVYWQHDGEYRVSKASFEHRHKTSELIYKRILDSNVLAENSSYSHGLGRFCIKMAWFAGSGHPKEYSSWLKRSRKLGYYLPGYNLPTTLLSAAGIKNGIRLKGLLKKIKVKNLFWKV
jgi:glycosyltransferase involved in cell wall biosynthesis